MRIELACAKTCPHNKMCWYGANLFTPKCLFLIMDTLEAMGAENMAVQARTSEEPMVWVDIMCEDGEKYFLGDIEDGALWLITG